MFQVRVYNDNIYPYQEMFKGELIKIAPKQYIELDLFDAAEFLGQYTSIQVDGGGSPRPQSYKMLRIVRPDHYKLEEKKEIICNACGVTFSTALELDEHVNEKHVDALTDEDEQKKRRKRKDE